MQPVLLSMHTQKFKCDYEVTNAKLDIKQNKPQVDVTRQKGGWQVESTPIYIDMDNTEVKESLGMKDMDTFVHEVAQTGLQGASEAASEYTELGDMMADFRNFNISSYAKSKAIDNYEMNIKFIPSAHPRMQVVGGQREAEFTPDKLDYNWHTNNKPEVDFTRGRFDFKVLQKPSLQIEYLGGPRYVPQSYAEKKLDVKA